MDTFSDFMKSYGTESVTLYKMFVFVLVHKILKYY